MKKSKLAAKYLIPKMQKIVHLTDELYENVLKVFPNVFVHQIAKQQRRQTKVRKWTAPRK